VARDKNTGKCNRSWNSAAIAPWACQSDLLGQQSADPSAGTGKFPAPLPRQRREPILARPEAPASPGRATADFEGPAPNWETASRPSSTHASRLAGVVAPNKPHTDAQDGSTGDRVAYAIHSRRELPCAHCRMASAAFSPLDG
jgi:hypothetical protein